MAGPGGGPPRKSHTKSRTGCQTCKRRHIRCDETFPQCQNCTKHTCRCDYNDAPVVGGTRQRSSEEVDLLWTADVEKEIQRWRQTRLLPCSDQVLVSDSTIASLSPVDLRLVHHVASVTAQLQRLGARHLVFWAHKIPIILALGDSFEFLMHSLLAFSATHLGWITGCVATENLASHHRGLAMRGLQQALPSFSRETSDAILGASLLLSWQSATVDGWISLARGITKVTTAMQPWKRDSNFAEFFNFSGPQVAADLSMQFNFTADDLSDLHHLDEGLANIESSVAISQQDLERMRQLSLFLHTAQDNVSAQNLEEQFAVLQQFRSWMLWLPASLLQISQDPGTLSVLAYFYATAVVIEPLFVPIGTAGFSRVVLDPLRQIARSIHALETHPVLCGEASVAMQLLELPLKIAKRAQRRVFGTFEKTLPYVDSHNFSPPFETAVLFDAGPFLAGGQQKAFDVDFYGTNFYESEPFQY